MLNNIRTVIQEGREELGYSLAEFSNLTGIPKPDLARIENGQLVPTKEALINIGIVLNKDLVDDKVNNNFKLFDLLSNFYELQVLFKEYKTLYRNSKEYAKFLEFCVYKDGLIFPEVLNQDKLNLSDIELKFIITSIEIMKLRIKLDMERLSNGKSE